MRPANDTITPRDAELARLEIVKLGHYVGNRYKAGATAAEIKRGLVADIKAALELGSLPAGLKVAVSSREPTGSALNRKNVRVRVTALPCGYGIHSPEWMRADLEQPHRSNRRPVRTREALAVIDALTALANAYNYDRSDSMSDHFDTAFWLSVDFARDLEQGDRVRVRDGLLRAFGEVRS